jgi:hypothetical protein
MGHVRLGRLPKTHRWQQVLDLLVADPGDIGGVANATMRAAEKRLRELARDPSLAYCFWLVARVCWASRGTDFDNGLAELGIRLGEADSALGFIARVSGHARAELDKHPDSGPFSELASLAMRRALSETVGQEGRSLFGTSLEDLQTAFRRQSSPVRFGVLARSFFGDFLARTLRYFVDKELANSVGVGKQLHSLESSRDFSAALDVYARQSARIMEDFAGEWYSKHNWESQGQISRDEADRFTAHALRKLRSEIRRSEFERSTA